MATVEELRLEIKAQVADAVGKLKSFQRTTQETGMSVSKFASQVGKEMVNSFKAFVGPAAVVALAGKAIGDLAKYVEESVTAFEGAQQSYNKLAQIIRATGGAAGFTAEEMSNFSTELSKATGQDDDAINDLQATLSTFKNVAGETFKRATSAAIDMAAAFGGDLTTNAMKLGRALEVPSEGLKVLSRIGVKFTSEQETMIDNFEKQGDIASAQGVILAALEGKVKGVAVAMNDSAVGAHKAYINATENLKEEQGRAIANGMKPYWGWLTKIKENLTAAAKASNDYEEAAQREYAGTATAIDKVTIARGLMNRVTAEGNIYYEEELESYRKLLAIAEKQVEWEGRLAARDKEQAAVVAAEIETSEKRKAAAIAWSAAKIKAEEDAAVAVYQLWEQEKEVAAWESDYLAKKIAEEQSAEDFLYELMKRYNEEELAAMDVLDARKEESNDIIRNQIDMQKELEEITLQTMESMGEAMGAAFVTGEEGWKAFGKAGLNAIAAVVEALAKQWALQAIAAYAALNVAAGIGYTAASVAAYAGAGAIKAIPMAEGGSGTVYEPTVFLAGEAGPEDYSFTPKNKGGQKNGGVTIIQNIGGSVISQREVMDLGVAGIAMAMRNY